MPRRESSRWVASTHLACALLTLVGEDVLIGVWLFVNRLEREPARKVHEELR